MFFTSLLHLVGYELFYLDFWVLCWNLICFSLIIYFFHDLLVGITAGSVEPLPHVKKYQTVIPQRLKVSSPIHDAAAAHQVRHKLQLRLKNILIYNNSLDWSRVFSPCLWTDVPWCSAVLCDFCRTKPHSASGKEQVRKANNGCSFAPGLSVWFLFVWPIFRDLVGASFTVTHFTDEGTRVSTAPDLWVSWLFVFKEYFYVKKPFCY